MRQNRGRLETDIKAKAAQILVLPYREVNKYK
jgi:hypothetical protein